MKQFLKYWLAISLAILSIGKVSAQLGTVFFNVAHDSDQNCMLTAGDELLPQVIISAQSLTTQQTFYLNTDSSGLCVGLLMRDSYEIKAHLIYGESLWQPCQLRQRIFIQGGGIDTVFVGLQSLAGRAVVTSDITSAWLAPCDTGWLNVALRNVGKPDNHQANYELILDESLRYLSYTTPAQGATLTQVSNNQLSIDVNRFLNTNTQFHIYLQVVANCNTIVPTHIYHNRLTNKTDSLPIAAPALPNIEISMQCLSFDSIQFLLRNRGTADMPTNSGYIVIEDDVMLRQDVYQLQRGQSTTVTLPSATSKTYRMEARQPAALPAIHSDSVAWAFRRGCDSTVPSINAQYANEFYAGDVTPFVEHDVKEFETVVAAVGQSASPKGYSVAHLIEQGTPLEYIIYFQNTGSAVLPFVSIVDTLSDFLDATTFEPMAASSEYEWSMTNNGRVQIMLSNALAAGGKGFFSFKIRPKSPLPLGTVIPNVAYVNLGFAQAVATNMVTHTIGNNFIRILSDKMLYQLDNGLLIYPNPVGDRATFELVDSRWGKLQLDVFNELGQLVATTQVVNSQRIDFERNNLAQGIYFYRLLCNGALCDTGKIILR